MDSNLLNISSVETFFNRLLYGKLTKNLFFTSTAEVFEESLQEFVVVDIDVNDNNIGDGFVNIFIYTKPIGKNKKNVSVISKMERTLNDIIDSNNDPNYIINRIRTYTDYDISRKKYFNVVSLKLSIV